MGRLTSMSLEETIGSANQLELERSSKRICLCRLAARGLVSSDDPTAVDTSRASADFAESATHQVFSRSH